MNIFKFFIENSDFVINILTHCKPNATQGSNKKMMKKTNKTFAATSVCESARLWLVWLQTCNNTWGGIAKSNASFVVPKKNILAIIFHSQNCFVFSPSSLLYFWQHLKFLSCKQVLLLSEKAKFAKKENEEWWMERGSRVREC